MSTGCSLGHRKHSNSLVEQMEQFFFGEGSALPQEFVFRLRTEIPSAAGADFYGESVAEAAP